MMMVVQNVFVHSVNAGCVENAGRSGSLARVAGVERKSVCLVCGGLPQVVRGM